MNIFKTFFSATLAFVFLSFNAYALEMGVEEAIESQSLKISLDAKTGTGLIIGKVCDACEKIKVTITPKTKAYEGATQVALAEAKNRLGRDATVIFDKETMEVIRIRW